MTISIFSQSEKKDTISLLRDEIEILTAQNNRLRQTNEILNKKLHEYFLHNLELVKDSAVLNERIVLVNS